VNDPDWLEYIGDRKVRSKDDAIHFIADSLNSKQPNSFLGLRVCCLKVDDANPNNVKKDTPIGLTGLLKRDYLNSIDIGYAFCKEYRGNGYAIEAAAFFKNIAFETLKVEKLYATVLMKNEKSVLLLKKIGFELLGRLKVNNIESQTTSLYVCTNTKT
jgi:RimJ/RimL family protein N-acetyltransferase